MSTHTSSEQKPRPSRGAKALERLFTGAQTSLYRLSGGAMGGRMGKSPILLLTTAGRKSGKKRTQPVLDLVDGTRWIIVASNGGSPVHPAWWFNLKTNPRAEVQIGRQTIPVTATTATPEERARLWPLLVAMFPRYTDYQKKVSREIPVVILSPV